MDQNKELTKEEFVLMLKLIKRHAELSMDQWETWKIDSEKGKLFIELKLSNVHDENAYSDLSEMLK
ncbi:hypothetical protein [Alteromonas sp. 009811495]|uniref:hypothetical protein n=1 Tax=Alteromonas sp. 009811495 TaxID=3002962 RepID=UPI00237E4C99|nr:hypothetical protein [Alteromonas sp. 009811495]WDT86669.1 hypothetical protein OZ660_02660 [Alteromonas sp. 009811495]